MSKTEIFNKINNEEDNIFQFVHKRKKYFININKLKEILAVLHFDLVKNDISSQENFKAFLKSHHLLVEEFLEYISLN
ncbi:MAG: hypothetical protein E7Z91_00540 [Cyanobacteria bacterium SIG30]|nr:hypothetical protein [Cyanobacteria bacterium SIG30]